MKHLGPRILFAFFLLTFLKVPTEAKQSPVTQTRQGWPLLFSEDFEEGHERWRVVDPKTWKLRTLEGNTTWEITERFSEYKPPVRSPGHIALIKDLEVKDFCLELKVRSTRDTGNHSQCELLCSQV